MVSPHRCAPRSLRGVTYDYWSRKHKPCKSLFKKADAVAEGLKGSPGGMGTEDAYAERVFR